MIDPGLLKQIASLRHDDDLATRDITAHRRLDAMRVYIRKAGPAEARTFMSYAADLGWSDPEGSFEAAFASSETRLARLDISIRHVQAAYSRGDGWLPRLKLFACLEGEGPKSVTELLAIWRAFGAPLDVAQRLARDGADRDLEHVAAIFGERGSFFSGETYDIPARPGLDCTSVEREASRPDLATTSLYVAWSTPIRSGGLARMTGAPCEDARDFMSALDIDTAPAITVSKRSADGGRERGVSIEIGRSPGEGEAF